MSKRRADELVARLEALGEPFERAPDCALLDNLEQSYGVTLPEPFRSLVQYYRWAEFEVGSLAAFSNLGSGEDYDLLKAPFDDKPMFEWLQANALIQIGRCSTGIYDPVCLKLGLAGAEPTVVAVDHEDILLCRNKVHVELLSESLEAMVRDNSRDTHNS